ncbi:MAG: hypothetical protein M3328_12170 [Chloroflexota bacterium]|nr:hypothetical protein [Chloroflexota bacterium]
MYAYLNVAANATNLQVTAYAPTIRALQTAGSYHRNQLTLTLDAVVVNRDSQTQHESAGHPVLFYLPPPRPGAAAVKGDTVYFGRPEDADYPPAGDAEWLGDPEHGSVRLYLSDPGPQILPLLSIIKRTVTGANTLVDADTASKLAAIREQGVALTVDKGKWHEESLIAHLPPNTTQGFVVVWRDDIPSVPAAFVRVPTVSCQPQDLELLIKEAFALVGAPPVELPVGGLLDLLVSPRLDEQGHPKANALTEVLRLTPGAKAEFGFYLKKNGQSATPTEVHMVEGQPSPVGGFTPANRIRCKFLPSILTDTDPSTGDTWSVEAAARLTLPGCSNPIFVNLARVTLTQKGLRVPSVAVFFEHQNYAGDPLVVLPSTTSLAQLRGKYYDDDTHSGDLTLARTAVGLMLGGFLGDLGLLGDFADVLGSLIPGAAAITAVIKTIDRLQYAQHPIIDATGKINNLADRLRIDLPGPWNVDYDNLISSMVLVSIPEGLTFKTWRDKGRQGRNRDFRMPAGHLVATVTDFHDLLNDTDTVTPLVLKTREPNYDPNEEDEYNDCVTVIDVA